MMHRSKRLARAIIKTEIAAHFNGPGNKHGRMDFRRELAKIACPVLMMAGEEESPYHSDLSQRNDRSMHSKSPGSLRASGNCGHNVVVDNPDRVLGAIREFILAV